VSTAPCTHRGCSGGEVPVLGRWDEVVDVRPCPVCRGEGTVPAAHGALLLPVTGDPTAAIRALVQSVADDEHDEHRALYALYTAGYNDDPGVLGLAVEAARIRDQYLAGDIDDGDLPYGADRQAWNDVKAGRWDMECDAAVRRLAESRCALVGAL
jgi:hypothetical protein